MELREKMNNEGSKAVRRALRIWQALKGFSHTGLSNAELSRITGESAPNVTRSLAPLIAEGLVVKLDNGRFAHGVRTLQIANAHKEHVDRMIQRINQTEGMIIAGSHPTNF